MKTVCVVTATRAEYGLLTPLIRRILDDYDLDLNLIVTGTHLSYRYGNTIDEIIEDGFPIAKIINILEEDNSPYGISLTMANAIKEFADYYRYDRPDMVVILGDRTEMLGVAVAAMNEQIPIAHVHGGELTAGAVDDCIRHAITKLSYLHFTSAEAYRKRVIQLGESPERVYNVGALGAENIINTHLMSEMEIRKDIGIPRGIPYAVITYHPETLVDNPLISEDNNGKNNLLAYIDEQISVLCETMRSRSDIFFVITGANADAGGNQINGRIEEFCKNCNNALFTHNLGSRRYLSAVKNAIFVMGNSSSGIIEAPILGVPSINIGDRQKGRIMSETVINCEMNIKSLWDAMDKAENIERHKTLIFGDGTTSDKIVEKIKYYLFHNMIDLKKEFYDL